MEFWGVEVKGGESLKVELNDDRVLHLSLASLGEFKDKRQGSVSLFVNIEGKKLSLGTLIPEKISQQTFDLCLDKNFELTHNWKDGSVFFCGYKAYNTSDESDESDSESDDSEDDIPLLAPINGRPSVQVNQETTAEAEKVNVVKGSTASKKKVKVVEPIKDVNSDGADDSSDEDDVMCADDDDDEEDSESGSDDQDDDDNDEEEEEAPKKVQFSKKRILDSASKTPVPDKKAKLVTPQKTDGKEGTGHVDTPHPSKKSGKTPAIKSIQQTPKSDSSHSCKACNRSFKSEIALDSHNKAKHRDGK